MENLENTDAKLNSSQTTPASGDDLMSVFEVGGNSNPGEGSDSKGAKTTTGVEDNTKQTIPEVERQIKEWQSRYDKLYHQNERTVQQLNSALEAKQLLNEIMEDDEVFEAFVFDRKPELLQKQDLTEELQRGLEEEFGPDFKPTRAEADANPGSRAWLYWKRLDELYESMKTRKAPKSLEELKKEREEQSKAQKEKIENEITKAKETLNWTDEEVGNFREWANKLSVIDLAKMFNFALRTQRIPNVNRFSGMGSKISKDRDSFLKSI